LCFYPPIENIKSQIIKKIIIRRAPGPYGASPTQPYKCSQYVKIKVKTTPATVGAELVYLGASQKFQPLHHPNKRGFDFNILTAFIRLGRVRPVGAGYPSYS
jgi:hypothetical protein